MDVQRVPRNTQRRWAKRLAACGFRDIERPNGTLFDWGHWVTLYNQGDGDPIAHEVHAARALADHPTAIFFRELVQAVAELPRNYPARDRALLIRYAETGILFSAGRRGGRGRDRRTGMTRKEALTALDRFARWRAGGKRGRA